MAWCWDAEQLQHILGDKKHEPNVIPETLLYPKHNDGLRLLQVSDGYEIQYWKDNCLKYSHICRQYPSAAEWLSFQRESAIPLEMQAPLPESALQIEWEKRVWLKNLGDTGILPRGAMVENISTILAITLFTGVTAWLTTQSALTTQEIKTREERLKSLEQTLRPLRDARQNAMESLMRSTEISRLAPYPDQFLILSKLAELLPENTGAYIREWEYQTGKLKLTLSVTDASTQLEEFINALQGDDAFFKAVAGSAASDGKSMVLELDISSRIDPK